MSLILLLVVSGALHLAGGVCLPPSHPPPPPPPSPPPPPPSPVPGGVDCPPPWLSPPPPPSPVPGGVYYPPPSPPSPPPAPVPGGNNCSPPMPTCSVDIFSMSACVDEIGCCPLIAGLPQLEAAICVCAAVKINAFSLNLYVHLLVGCGMTLPDCFTCP
ncbi:36.4 kDa proline-rich protein-like [Salvia hispanica]|uniref:36.4 kDa proline-rich protein-like n=1 Tax=Salvia hispanica TaxID=49212 RepID=UPI002009AAB1|nr:36.4 kDa proline-rich protein-like [Salvia hispanica]